jgi:hypothetical protein
MIGWDELTPIREGEILRVHAEVGADRDDQEQVLFRGRRWKRMQVDDLGIDEPTGPAGDEEESHLDHQLRPIGHYLDQRVRRVLARLSTPEELAAHCMIVSAQETWEEGEWRAQERLLAHWQPAGVLLRMQEVTLERQQYLVARLRHLSSHGFLIVQEWNDQIVPPIWDNSLGREQVAAQWGSSWAAAGVDCALLVQSHPLWKLPLDSGQLEALVTGMARSGLAVGRCEPPARITLGLGLGTHSCDWRKLASRETVRWTPPGLRPLRLIDCRYVESALVAQLLLLGECDGLLIHSDLERMVALLVNALRERLLTEEQLLERAYRLILLREWLTLCRPEKSLQPA